MTDIIKELDFNISLPKGWQDQTMYYFKGPRIDDFDHEMTLNIDRFLQHAGIIDFAREKTRPLTSSMTGIEILKDEETTVEGCNASYEFVYKWIPADDIIEIHKYVFVLKEQMGFAFNVRFNKKTYKLLGTQIKEIIEKVLPGTYEPPFE
jgi:hypothetical protein